MSNKLPNNDMSLEIEEVEGLVSSVGSGRRGGGVSSFSARLIGNFLRAGNRRRHIAALVGVVLLLVLVLHSGRSGDAADAQKEVRPGLVSVEQKSAPGAIATDDSNGGGKGIETSVTAGEPKPDETGAAEVEKPEDNKPLTEEEKKKKELTEKWGEWHFWDGDEDVRPKEDYCAKYPNRDIPGDDFPEEAWQVDAVYVNHFLNDAAKLVDRAKEAIYAEYGHGKPLPPEEMMDRVKMFHLEMLNLTVAKGPPQQYSKRGNRGGGGWTSERSLKGLARRLLHAMMTNDSFTVVMGGHSAAAGHGNHFKQSYMMQFHKIMEPIFNRLGVKLISRNIAQGGLGTMQAAIGAGSIYGEEVDMLLWDSSMTENDPYSYDVFARQGLLGSNRAPVLWGGNFDVLKLLHEHADADVGQFGQGLDGVIVTENEKQALTVPYAARYMKCTNERQDLCNAVENKYKTKCWIEREGVTPPTKQRAHSASQVSWHPGWRFHQLIGRVLAFTVLEALEDAISMWSEVTITGGHPLPDEYWHVTEHYNNIHSKVKNMDPKIGFCQSVKDRLPLRVCTTRMYARTEFTPRANPDLTSIRSILKPAPDGYVPEIEDKMLYEGEDVHNPVFDIPDGEIDVLAIVSNRRRLQKSYLSHDVTTATSTDENAVISRQNLDHDNGVGKNAFSLIRKNLSRWLGDSIVPGRGWQIRGEPPGVCDGSYYGICGRGPSSDCLLSGHMDGRGGILGNEFSGWIVMNLKNLKEGIIMIKMETWHRDAENTRTAGWTTVNNETRRLGHGLDFYHEDSQIGYGVYDEKPEDETFKISERLLKTPPAPELPETFSFDYAIDGNIKSFNKTEFHEQRRHVQRVVEIWTLLDDPNFIQDAPKEVELAVRVRGCQRICTFSLTHVYWA